MNRRFSLAAALILAATSIGSIANAGSWVVGAHGGAAIPMGDFADENKGNAQTGWQAGGSVDFRTGNKWGFGLDGSMNKNSNGIEGETVLGTTFDEATFNTWQFGAHANMMFPMEGAFHPYALLGLGAYNTKAKVKSTTGGVSSESEGEGDTRPGGKIGLGGEWMFSPTMGLGLEAAYNMVTLDKDTAGYSSLQYVGLQAGFRFSLPSAGK